MTPVTKSSELAEQWKRKCSDFSNESNDNLVPIIWKVIDTLTVYLKDSAHSRLQPSLKTLEAERSIYLSEEASDVPSIRIMMYGIIQAVHGLLLAKTALNDSNSSEAKAILEMVGDWKIKCCVLSNDSEDIILPVFIKVFDAIVMILKGAEQSRIQTTLKSLEYELSVCKFPDNIEVPSIRTLMYGVLECVHGCLLDMTALKNSIPSKEIHRREAHIVTEMKHQSEDGFSTIPDFTIPPVVPKKEEPIDPSSVVPEDNQSPVFTLPPKNELKEEIEDAEQMNSVGDDRKMDDGDMMNGVMNAGMDNGFDVLPLDEENEEELVENKSPSSAARAEKRSSRRISKPVKYVDEGEDSDGEKGSSIKKPKSNEKNGKRRPVNEDAESEPDNKKRRVAKNSDTEMKCPECTYQSNSAKGWICHLRAKHSTTPSLAGLALRCSCGHEGVSDGHSHRCKVANFTVIRKRNGPIRRLDDAKETPQCILCQVYPKTALGFIYHLEEHHHTTLLASGIELECGCGLLITSKSSSLPSHKKQCDGREYTLHKIDEK